MGLSRAILISGPPGIGKTTSAHLMAKMAGYSPIELNASDVRSKKLIEVSFWISLTCSHKLIYCRIPLISTMQVLMVSSLEVELK